MTTKIKTALLISLLFGSVSSSYAGWLFTSTYEKAELAYERHNYVEAVKLYAESCSDENFQGCNDTGYMYEHGLGVAQSDTKANELYVKACNGGWGGACFNIKALNAKMGMDKVISACDDGDKSACVKVVSMYMDEKSKKRNYLKASTILYGFCKTGNLYACADLGRIYARGGDGLGIDYFKAFEFSNKACSGELSASCNDVGTLYKNGQGVRLDLTKAADFYGKACDMQNPQGCESYRQLKSPQPVQQVVNNNSNSNYQQEQLAIQRQQQEAQAKRQEEQDTRDAWGRLNQTLQNTSNKIRQNTYDTQQLTNQMQQQNDRLYQQKQDRKTNYQLQQINNNLNNIRYGY